MMIDSSTSAEISDRSAARAETLRVAVVGLGARGIGHATALATMPNCELVGLADPRAAARRNLRGMGHAAPGYRKVEQMLAKASPRAVFVSAPLPARAGLARMALEHGCAVFVERPMATTAEEGAGLVALAAEQGVPLAVSHTLAFEPVFDAARRAVSSGALGKVSEARASMYASRVFNAREAMRYTHGGAGGVLAHMSVDLLFVLGRMFGAPLEVRATASRLYGTLEDELHAMMTTESGAEVGFDSSWSVPGHPHPATVIELAAERGHLLVSDDAMELDLSEPGAGFLAGHTRRRIADLPQPARFDMSGEARWLEDAAFVAWASGGSAPANTGAAALQTQRVMEALYDSARSAGASVSVAR
jgi:predicted dehydrogenase